MFNSSRVPLARLNLFHSKARLSISVGGVAFAVLLMFVEMGFLNGLFDSQTFLVTQLNADLIMMSNSKEATIPALPFPRSRLIQAKGFAGVAAAYPLYLELERARWKSLPANHSSVGAPTEHKILVFGFDPDDPVFLTSDVVRQAPMLKAPDTALFDIASKSYYGEMRPGTACELSHRRIHVVGTFPLGADFRIDGNVLVSDQTFFNAFPDRRTRMDRSGKVELGLIKLDPGADPAAVQRAMALAFDDVSVLTREQFQTQIRRFWGDVQPVGFIFGMGMLFGFVIGVAICYQILYTDIADHMPQYATLKAIGYSNAFVVNVVVRQAIYLALLGFVPGAIFSVGIYALLHRISGMVIRITADRLAEVCALTLTMCILAAIIAVRRAVRSDPAEVF